MIKTFTAIALALLAATAAEAQSSTTRYYDSMGRSSGSAVRSGNTIRYYDSMGRSKGSSTSR